MTKKYLNESIKLGSHDLIVETGKVAKQADGSVVIRYGDTMLLVAAVSAHSAGVVAPAVSTRSSTIKGAAFRIVAVRERRSRAERKQR